MRKWLNAKINGFLYKTILNDNNNHFVYSQLFTHSIIDSFKHYFKLEFMLLIILFPKMVICSTGNSIDK